MLSGLALKLIDDFRKTGNCSDLNPDAYLELKAYSFKVAQRRGEACDPARFKSGGISNN
jgi:hypothetical protein